MYTISFNPKTSPVALMTNVRTADMGECKVTRFVDMTARSAQTDLNSVTFKRYRIFLYRIYCNVCIEFNTILFCNYAMLVFLQIQTMSRSFF